MRLCLMVEGQEDVSWEQWCALAEATEAAGLDGFFRSDHYLSSIGGDDRGGRVELGIGAGWNEPEHAAYGFPFPDLRVRMEMLAEQIEIVHSLWTDTHVGFEGLHYRLEDCTALPRPLQRPRPP